MTPVILISPALASPSSANRCGVNTHRMTGVLSGAAVLSRRVVDAKRAIFAVGTAPFDYGALRLRSGCFIVYYFLCPSINSNILLHASSHASFHCA